MTRGLSPAATYQTYPAEKKRRNFTEEQHFRRAAVSAALLSKFSQQPFSAALLSSSSQQLFSAAFSAALLSRFSQQPFSAALFSSSFQQLFSAIILLWSGVGGQLVTSSCRGQVCYRSLEGPFRNAFGKTSASSTKIRQPKRRIRQPKLVNQNGGFVNQGSSTNNAGFVKRWIRQSKAVASSTKKAEFVQNP